MTSAHQNTAAPAHDPEGSSSPPPEGLFERDRLLGLGLRVTQADFARIVGVTKQAVSVWVKQGRVVVGSDGRLDPVAALASYIRTADPRQLRVRWLRGARADLDSLQGEVATLKGERDDMRRELATLRATLADMRSEWWPPEDVSAAAHALPLLIARHMESLCTAQERHGRDGVRHLAESLARHAFGWLDTDELEDDLQAAAASLPANAHPAASTEPQPEQPHD